MSSSENLSRRLSSILNIDLLDPLLEAMIDGVFVPGGTSVSVEFNFLPFVVEESDMDHQWHPGPMEVDDHSDDDAHDEDKDDEQEGAEGEEGEEGEEEEEGEEGGGGMPLFSDGDEYDEEYNNEEEEEYNEEEEDYAEGIEEEEEDGANDYSSQHDDEDEENEDEEEDDEEEDEDEEDLELGYINDSVRETYGILGHTIHNNMLHRKILNDTFNSRFFLRQMVEYFFTHLKQEGNLASSLALQKLLVCLPPLSDLKHVITKSKYTGKEAIIIKIVLEMYENYHRHFGAPNFKVYHQEVVPVLLEFYTRLPDIVLRTLPKQLKQVLLNLQHLIDNFMLFSTKEGYITHYRDATRKMRNLSESTDPSLFLR